MGRLFSNAIHDPLSPAGFAPSGILSFAVSAASGNNPDQFPFCPTDGGPARLMASIFWGGVYERKVRAGSSKSLKSVAVGVLAPA